MIKHNQDTVAGGKYGMIAITDYGMGNLGSVKKALDYLGAPCQITKDPQLIRQASHVILPGVGAFADAMDELERRGLVGPLEGGHCGLRHHGGPAAPGLFPGYCGEPGGIHPPDRGQLHHPGPGGVLRLQE